MKLCILWIYTKIIIKELLSFIYEQFFSFSAFVEAIIGANIEMMKQPATGADSFYTIFETKFGLNFPPYFSQKSLRREGGGS